METYSRSTRKTTSAINTIRQEVKDHILLSSDFTKIFQANKVAYALQFSGFLVRKGILTRTDCGGYKFADHTKPVHVHLIEDFIQNARKSQREYNKRHKDKSVEVVVAEPEIVKPVNEFINVYTQDGFRLQGIETFDYRVVKVCDKIAVIDSDNKVIKVL